MRKHNLRKNLVLAGVVVLFAGPAWAQERDPLPEGDATRGEAVFRQCMTCHTIEEGVNRLGPSLYNVVGRPAGTLASFPRYSKAMKDYGQVWTEENLDPYLENPRKFLPRGNMAYGGVRNRQQRADVIAFLRSHSPDAPPADEGEPSQ